MIKTAAILAAASAAALGVAQAQTVDVTVEGVEPGDGPILLALQSEDEFLKKAATYTATADADAETVMATFEDVAPGTYVVAVVHDTNADGDFTVTDTGVKEAWGISGEKQKGAPAFGPASIMVPADGTAEATITLKYPKKDW